jgi:NAD(P)H dehydrogenase (quinone)
MTIIEEEKMTQQKDIVIPYYSASGHTKALAEAILEGVKSINKNASLINISEITEKDWEALQSAEGIIFGSPTYVGGVAGAFKVFLDDSSSYKSFWVNQVLVDKMAAAFTVATYPSGDKLSTLMQLAIFAAQHGMIWVNNAGVGNKVSPEEKSINACGSWLGLMATSIPDKTKLISETDKSDAFHFGKRFAESVARWTK